MQPSPKWTFHRRRQRGRRTRITSHLEKQALMFVETQYRGKQDVDAQDAFNDGNADEDTIDTTNRKKGSTKPSDIEKKKMIDEILSLSGVLVETPGRALEPQLIWSIIGDVTTDLSKEDDAGVGECGDEELLSNIYNEMHDVWFATTSGGDLEQDEQLRINIVPDADAVDEAEAQVSDDEQEVEVTTTEGSEQVEIGKKRKKLKVTKVPMSPFADTDTYAKGHSKLMNQDLPTVRRRRKQRQTREQKALHDNLFQFQMNIGSDFESVMGHLQWAMTEPEQPFRRQRYVVSRALRRKNE